MTDWIEHTGDTCPVDPETVVEVQPRATFMPTKAGVLGPRWQRGWASSITHYRIITPAKPPEPEMTGFIATLTDEQKAAALAYCGDDHHGPPKPEPDLITLRLECLKLAAGCSGKIGWGSYPDTIEELTEVFLHYVLNGSVDKA